jgi:hypothetical protein
MRFRAGALMAMVETSRTPAGAVNATIARNPAERPRIQRMAESRGRFARGVLFLATMCACASTPAPMPTPSQARVAKRSRVVITIVVDQLAGWIADERWPLLPRDGGFARLIREGTWVKRLRYAHAATDTAPGHSALYTALPPHDSGIFANEVPDAEGARVSILRDAQVHRVTEDGVDTAPGASLASLGVDTLADRLHRAEPDAVVLGLSLKDRGALFGAGRSPRAAIWFEPKLDRFVTSTAVAETFPRWALPVVSRTALARIQSQTWSPLDATFVAAHARTPDDQPGEGDEKGFGRVFPHVLSATREPGYALRTSPFGDDVLFALAEAGIDAEKVTEHDALIAISLSANDYIGHVFGPDSWEAWDELSRLDRALAGFLRDLDARFGRDGYAVLLTGDHGVTAMPEATLVAGVRTWCNQDAHESWDRACGAVGRILPDEVLGELREASRRALGAGDWVATVIDPYVYLTPAARGLEPRRLALLDETISATLRGHPEVDHVTPTRTLPAKCPPETDESIAALVCRSFAPGAGDYYVVPSRGSFFDPSVVVGKGTSHGSPYLFDRTVPLLAYAPGRIAGGVVVDGAVGYETFARTAATLLGIDPPGNGALGADLFAGTVVAVAPPAPALSVVVEGHCPELRPAFFENATFIQYGHVPGVGEAQAAHLTFASYREDGSIALEPKMRRGIPVESAAYSGGAAGTTPLDVSGVSGTWPDDAHLTLTAISGNRMGTESGDYVWKADHWAEVSLGTLESKAKPGKPWLSGSSLALRREGSPYPELVVTPAGAAPVPDFTALHVPKPPVCVFMESDVLTRPSGELYLAGKFCGIFPTHEHGEWRYDGPHPPVWQGEAAVARWAPGSPATVMALPPVANHANLELQSFLEASPTTMYLFGTIGRTASQISDTNLAEAYLAFYDGSEWSRIETPYAGPVERHEIEADGTLWVSDSAHDLYRRAPDGAWSKQPLAKVTNDAWQNHRPAWAVAGGALMRHGDGDEWTRVELPRPTFSASARFSVEGVSLSRRGDLWVRASYEERRPEWRRAEKREALLRLGATAAPTHCDADVGPSFSSWPPPATEACKDPVVILARVSTSAPPTFGFPQTRAAVRGHAEIAGAEFVEIEIDGQRLLAAKVTTIEMGKRLAEIVGHGVAGARPEVVCVKPKVTREVSFAPTEPPPSAPPPAPR